MAYLDRLAVRVGRTRSCLCLGIDPDPGSLPDGWPDSLAGIESFGRLLLEAASGHASAVKANLAFFEAWGSAGVAALERLRMAVPDDIPFIADAKRADIRSTSVRHAAALFDALGADAVTVSPYLGGGAVEPLLERGDRFSYVLCRTSDQGSAELQDLHVSEAGDPAEARMPLYLLVASRSMAWAAGRPTVGLVVGATAPAEMARVRAAAPDLPFLVPGVGSQGGDVDETLRHGPATAGPASAAVGGGLLVNVSRGIARAALGPGDPGAALHEAASGWAARLRV